MITIPHYHPSLLLALQGFLVSWNARVTEIKGKTMRDLQVMRELKVMSVDELWSLHEKLVHELSRKMKAERAMLEERLGQLRLMPASSNRGRRPYPKVVPKYRNPKNPDETWAGRGKQPRWLKAQLRAGNRIDDFLIRRS